MWEFFKSLVEASRNRLKSPILGTYTICFIIWNWRAIAILIFSDFSIEDRIFYIDNWLTTKWCILGPLLLASLIIFALPRVMLFVDQTLEGSNLERKRIRNKEKLIDLNQLVEEASKEFEIQNQKSGTKTVEELQDKISLLEQEKNSLLEANKLEREKNLNDINNLNLRLKEFNQLSNDTINSIQYESALKAVYDNNLSEDYLSFFDVNNKSNDTLKKSPNYKIFLDFGLLDLSSNKLRFTDLGTRIFLQMLEIKYLSKDKNLVAFTASLKPSEIRFIKEAKISENYRYAGNSLKILTPNTVAELTDFGFMKMVGGGNIFTNEAKSFVQYLKVKYPDIPNDPRYALAG
jgi:hypothetical protein